MEIDETGNEVIAIDIFSAGRSALSAIDTGDPPVFNDDRADKGFFGGNDVRVGENGFQNQPPYSAALACMGPKWPSSWRLLQNAVSEQTCMRVLLLSSITSTRNVSSAPQRPQQSSGLATSKG